MSLPPLTLALTALAMLAFAGNSILARLALGDGAIDGAGYTGVRLASGALLLAVLLWRHAGGSGTARPATPRSGLPGSWISALALFVYAIAFSLAYLSIDAATGALVLFSTVQATMIGTGLARGERPGLLETLGLVVALAAFAWWIAPAVTTPAFGGAALMIVSGIAWGAYSLRGRGAHDPTAVTAGNFIRTVPAALLLLAISAVWGQMSWAGFLTAVGAGAGASGLGYIVWYAALPRLTASRAAIVQLSVPVLAAAGGVLLLGEALTLRFVIAGVLILGGIALALSARMPQPSAPAADRRS